MDYQRLAMNWLKGEFTGTTMFEGENTMVSGSMFQVQSMEAELLVYLCLFSPIELILTILTVYFLYHKPNGYPSDRAT